MTNRILSLILLLALLVSWTVPAFASDDSGEMPNEVSQSSEGFDEASNTEDSFEDQNDQADANRSEENESGSEGSTTGGSAPEEPENDPPSTGGAVTDQPDADDTAPDQSTADGAVTARPSADGTVSDQIVFDDLSGIESPDPTLQPESVATVSTALSKPVISKLTNLSNGIEITWGAVEGAEKYRVFYRIGSGNWIAIVDTSSTSYTWTGASSGVRYTFTVRCISADGSTYTSDQNSGRSITYTPALLASPELSSVVNTPNGVSISWNAVEGAKKYRVFYRTDSIGWTTAVDTASTSYTWAGAKSGTLYYFTVRCISEDGHSYTSDYNEGVSITYTPKQLDTPELTSVNHTSAGVVISWEAVNEAEKYRVFYKNASGSWIKIADTSSTSYTWTGAEFPNAYTFTVRCISADGSIYTSDFNPAGISIDVKLLDTPLLSSVSNTFNGVTLTWGAIDGAKMYRVFYKNASGAWIKITDTASTSYTWTGAKSGTHYTFTVRCISADGKFYTSDFDQGEEITYLPKQLDTPELISANNTSAGVVISWKAVDEAEKYCVFYKNASGSWTKIADTSSTSYTWTGAEFPNAYTFTVRCISADGSIYTSDFNPTGISIIIDQLDTPILSSVDNTFNGVTLTWDAIDGAKMYRVFYKNASGAWTKIADTSSTSYTWTGAKSGTHYTFTVRCVSADGKFYTSDFDQGKEITYLPKQLDMPRLTSVSNASDGVIISWEAVDEAEKYRVFYKNASGVWTKIADTSSTSYTWTGAILPNTYTFTVRCISDDGSIYTSSFDPVGITLAVSKLDAPKITSVTNRPQGVLISWGAVNGARKYRVFYKTGSTGWIKLVDTTSTSFGWLGAEVDTVYTFTIRCISDDGKAYTSDYVSEATVHTNPISFPTVLAPINTPNGIKISWGAVTRAQKYRVFYKTESTGWIKLTDTTSTSYTWTGAKSGTTYTFTVRCISADGKSYISSYDKKGKSITYTPQKLATPALSANTVFGGVTISWNAVAGADKYRVFYKTGSSGWTTIADTTSTSYTWTGAKNGTNYTFTVRCISADGKSYTSDFDPGQNLTYWAKQPAAPSLHSLTNTFNGITISWGAVDGATKYRVFYKSGSGSWTKLVDTTSTRYTWTGAKSGTNYNFTVRCISADGKSYTSDYDPEGMSITYTPVLLNTPKLSSVINTSNGVKITWDAVEGAKKYRVFYKTASGNWTKIGNTTSTSFTWTGAKSNTYYTFTVRCISEDGSYYTSDFDTKGISIIFW